MSKLIASPHSGEPGRRTRLGAPGRLLSRRSSRHYASLLAALAAFGAPGSSSAAPTLERAWGTYFGVEANDVAVDAGQDAIGNIYILIHNNMTSPLDSPLATPGAHKAVSGGLNEAFLAKFSPDGVYLWGTYFGGESTEIPYRLTVADDIVVIAGKTASGSGIATPGAFQEEKGGVDDAFVAAFTTDGALAWATYIGSAEKGEPVDGVASDADGFVYVAGRVHAAVPGLGSPGTHQPEHGGGTDGYLVKFTPQGEVVWGTYYGGPGYEAFDGVSVNALGEIYVAGDTPLPSAAVVSAGAHQPEFGGGTREAFLVRFNPDGTRAWGTYYGGEQNEHGMVVAAVPQGGVVLGGQTSSATGIATPGTHQPTPGRSFIARFDAGGTRLWGTYYGGADDPSQIVSSYTVRADDHGNVYVCGITDSPDDIATPNGYQTTLNGSKDGFLFKFTGDGLRQWSTYYGGTWWDGCYSLIVGGPDSLYIVGGTGSTTTISSPGAHDETLFSYPDWDAFIVRFTESSLGAACTAPADCGGGPCVDGVCCDSACGDGGDDCQTCSAGEGALADGVCTLLGADVVCRPSMGACDVAEHCSGDAATCPADVQADDGEPCDDGVCSAGACVPAGTSGTTTVDETSDTSTGAPHDTTTTTVDETSDTSTSAPHDTTATTVDETSDTSTSALHDTTTTTVDSTGNSPTSTGEPSPTGSAEDTSRDTDAATGAAHGDDGSGCGCRSDGDGALLGSPLLLLLAYRPRRRREPGPRRRRA